jgi:hypothetical protein
MFKIYDKDGKVIQTFDNVMEAVTAANQMAMQTEEEPFTVTDDKDHIICGFCNTSDATQYKDFAPEGLEPVTNDIEPQDLFEYTQELSDRNAKTYAEEGEAALELWKNLYNASGKTLSLFNAVDKPVQPVEVDLLLQSLPVPPKEQIQ